MKRLIFYLLLVLMFFGCSSDSESTTKVVKRGVVSDGYLKGATVCIDLNGNSECDEGEPQTITAEDGSYYLEYDGEIPENSSLMAYGGIDTATNQEFTGVLKAPIEYENVSPVTTLVDYQKKAYESLDKAEEAIAELFGLEVATLTQDPIAQAKIDNKLFKTALKVQKILDVVASLDSSDERDLKKIDRLLTKVVQLTSKTQDFIDAVVEAAEVEEVPKDRLEDNLRALDSVIEKKVDEQTNPEEAEKIVEVATEEVVTAIEEDKPVTEDSLEEKINECSDNLDSCLETNSVTTTDTTTQSDENTTTVVTDENTTETTTTETTDTQSVEDENVTTDLTEPTDENATTDVVTTTTDSEENVTEEENTTEVTTTSTSTTSTTSTSTTSTSTTPTSTTDPLTVDGTPKVTAKLYEYYHFIPEVNKDNVTFSIENKPQFLDFNETTGELSGVVTEEGAFSAITITANDGSDKVSLPPFTLTVLPKENLSLNYATATQPPQGDYAYYKSPEYTVDGDLATYNYTEGDPEKNWLELKLPEGTTIQEINVVNKANDAYDLGGTVVYICKNSIEGNVSNIESSCQAVKELSGIIVPQSWEANETIEGNYVVLKAADDNHLYVAEVEVFGTLPDEPKFSDIEEYNLVAYKDAKAGSKLLTVKGVDYQNDQLTYSVNNSDFTIDNDGNIYANKDLEAGEYTIEVAINDGKNTVTQTIVIEVNSEDALAQLLKSGDITQNKITEGEILDEILAKLTTIGSETTILETIYGSGNKIEYTPSNSSQYFKFHGSLEKVKPILVTNEGYIIALVNNRFNGKFISFGASPIKEFADGNNDAFEPYFKNIVEYMLDGKTRVNVYPANSEAKDWLNDNFDNLDVQESSLDTETDLVIISDYSKIDISEDDFKAQIQTLLDNGTAILYLHDDWGNTPYSEYMASLNDSTFPYAGMFFKNTTSSWADYKEMNDFYIEGYVNLFTHIKNQDYNFDWSKCKDSADNYTENGENCEEVVGLNENFTTGATRVREILNGLDEHKVAIFDQDDFELEKLYVLLGDLYKQDVQYPMSKLTTDQTEFFKSLYSDYAVYNSRKIVPIQEDMGNFSRSDFSHISPTTRDVTITSKIPFRSTGAYALPGQTFKVTRSDSTDTVVKVFVNSIKYEATHEYLPDGYKRPKFLQTAHVEVKPNETIEITSVYGGPIQVEFDKNGNDVSLKFENVGEHPYWQSSDDNDKFADALNANEYDWAEISTETFEVHSKLDKMLETITNLTSSELVEQGEWTYVVDKDVATGADVADAIQKYTANHPFGLAGFKGTGIDDIDEANSFAEDHNITINEVDFVKHMNADQASCGYGCSGNPYDAYWAFDPLGHGDIHEIGHGLENKRFLFDGWEGHALTNPYVFYTKSMYYKDTGRDPNCKILPFEEAFNAIKADDMANHWSNSDWADQVMFTIQAMMSVQDMGKLKNGWHLLTRLHMLEREFSRAKVDETTWDDKKESLGFGNYSYDDIKTISNNDWMAIALSYTAGVDFRDYLDMWGLSYSDTASSQIESFEYDAVPRKFFAIEEVGNYCKTNDDGGMLYNADLNMTDEDVTYPYSDSE